MKKSTKSEIMAVLAIFGGLCFVTLIIYIKWVIFRAKHPDAAGWTFFFK